MKIMDSVDDGQDDDRVNLFCICYNLELFRTLVRGAIGAFGKRRIIKLFLCKSITIFKLVVTFVFRYGTADTSLNLC